MKLIGVLRHFLGWTSFASFLSRPPHAHGAFQKVTPVDFSKHGGNWVEGNCASRERQSPIDLNELFKPPQGTFNFKYAELPPGKNITITNDGRVISASLQDGSLSALGGLALELDGEQQWFSLASIEVRSRSEHTLRGKHFPLEIQLVHRPSHFSGGPKTVTISIFVDCQNPPQAKAVYPGLLQTQVASKKRLRGNNSFAFLQRTPSVDDNDDEDPIHLRLNAEVNFVHSLVEGEDALAANEASTTPSPADANETANVTYIPPPSGSAEFNSLLQFLVAEEPPDLDTATIVTTKPGVLLRLAAMVASGTYFYYWGSQTLPPCAPNEVWLVKREPMRASTEQVTTLFETLHLMSGGAGNFRTIMPLNGRIAEVLKSEEGIPRSLMPDDSVPERTVGDEAQYVEASQDAITLAKAATDYAKDMDWRVQKAAVAHLNALAATTTTTFAPTTSVFIPKPPGDAIWATNVMKNILKDSLKKAVDENVKEMIPATASLTISYLRQRILKNAGFHLPPPGAQLLIPTPIPGVPTFKPPEIAVPVTMNITQIMAVLIGANCTSTNATCAGIPGISPSEAHRYIARFCAMNLPAFTCNVGDDGMDDDEEDQMTPDDISLPDGVDPVPSDWPDPDAGQWGSGLPPSGIPPSWNSNWPDPNGYKPAGWGDYEWQRYKWNWQIYNSRYTPYRSSYRGYSINRRRRGFAARGYNSNYRNYRSRTSNYQGYGGQRRRGYSSGRWGRSSSRSRYSSSRSRRYSSNYGRYSSRSRRYSSSSRRYRRTSRFR